MLAAAARLAERCSRDVLAGRPLPALPDRTW
jgi:hypothetical protein